MALAGAVAPKNVSSNAARTATAALEKTERHLKTAPCGLTRIIARTAERASANSTPLYKPEQEAPMKDDVKQDDLRIYELRAENFKRLSAITIRPDGSVIVISGRNGQGKTSAIDAIAVAIGGKKAAPAEPIRKGQDKAEINLDLGRYK